MIRLLFLTAMSASIIFILMPGETQKTLSHSPPPADQNPQWVTSPITQSKSSTEYRRKIFCELVEESKKQVLGSLERAQIVAFDLATPEQKWDFLKPVLQKNGCPAEADLVVSLGIRSVADIELGTIEGSDPCHFFSTETVPLYSR